MAESSTAITNPDDPRLERLTHELREKIRDTVRRGGTVDLIPKSWLVREQPPRISFDLLTSELRSGPHGDPGRR
jgi:hypothetical protein